VDGHPFSAHLVKLASATTARALAQERAKAKVEAEQQEAREAAAHAQAEAFARTEKGRQLQAIDAMEGYFRPSLGIENSWVLNLRNTSGITVDFQLRCFNNNNQYKTFPIAITAGQSQEIGFLEGWDGNFVSGEYCQAIYDGKTVWTARKK
jgi:hypothetical protein